MTPLNFFGRNPLRGLLWIFAGLAAGIIAAGVGYHRTQVAHLRAEVAQTLEAVAALKTADLTRWRAERLSDARWLQTDETLAARVRAVLAQPEDAARQWRLRDWLQPMQLSHGYRMTVFDADGRLRLATDARATAPAAVPVAVVRALRSGEVEFKDFFRDETTGKPLLALIVPLRGADGALVVEIDPAFDLYPALGRWPLPAQTPEALLVRREGDQVVFLNPLRFRPDAALSLRFPLTRTDLPAVSAVLGHEGVMEGLDYRGVRVLAALRTVPDSPWHLVARVDLAEALAGADAQLGEVIVIVVTLLLCAALGLSVLWSRQQARLVREKFLTTQALHGSEARYRSVVESANDAIVTIDTAGKITGWHGAAPKIFHAASAEILGQPFTRLLAPAEHARFLADLHLAQSGGTPEALGRVFDVAGRRADGALFPMEVSVSAWHVSGERFLTATIRDITGRRRAEETLRLQSTALTAAANGIVITERDGTIVWVNPAFSALTGYALAEVVGRNPRDLVKSGRQDQAFYDQLWATITAGRVWHGELINRRKDGSLYPEEQTITPVRDAAGTITHFIGIKQDLTEKKAVDEMVQASRRQFQAVFEQAAVGMVIAEGSHGKFVSVNRRFCAMTGYTAEELRALTSHDITHPDDVAADDEHLARISRGEIPEFSREKRYRKKDGTYFWARAFVAPLDPSERHPTLRIGVIQDISERKAIEEKLQRERQLFKAVVEKSSEGIVLVERDGRIVYGSPATTRVLGRTAEEFMGQSAFRYVHPEDVDSVRQAFAALLQTPLGEGMLREFRVQHEDGTWRHLEVTGTNLLDDPSVRAVVLNFRDITERKAAAAALQANEARYRLLFENNPFPMWVYDAETLRIFAVNESAVNHYGYTREEFCVLTSAQLHPPEEAADLLKFLHAGRQAGKRSGTWRHRKKDGTILHVEVYSSPMKFEGRDARLVLINDITEKKLLEAKFLHAQRLESLGLLAAGVAHDLNNVLAPIVFAAPLLRSSLTSERDLKILATLERSAERGSGLVKQILGFARSTTSEPASVQVKHLARDIADMIEATFPKAIQFEHHIPSDLWPVLGNPTQLHQVLLNLCVNARDAMPSGGTLRLSVRNCELDAAQAQALPGAQPGRWLLLEVADTGTGIAPEVLAHIWDPFFTTKPAGKGTGLGLSTVRGIVTQHHGFIAVESRPGHGAKFQVYLPALVERAAGETPGAAELPPGHGELLLVVDDDVAIRDTVTAMLAKQGYRVLAAGDGIEAVEHFTRHAGEIALVLTDVDMPHLGGDALARILIGMQPSVRLLVMSGLASIEHRGEIATARKLAHSFLQKPFTAESLLAAVHDALQPAAIS